MKLFRTVALGLATPAALLSGTAFAQTSPAKSTFNVNLTVVPKCFVNLDASGPSDDATGNVTLSYDAFQVGPARDFTTFTVSCTKEHGYSISVTSDTGTIAGIPYYLKVAAGATPQYVDAVGGGTLGSLKGDGAAQTYTIGVSAPGGEAGDCTGSCGGSQLHTIEVAY